MTGDPRFYGLQSGGALRRWQGRRAMTGPKIMFSDVETRWRREEAERLNAAPACGRTDLTREEMQDLQRRRLADEPTALPGWSDIRKYTLSAAGLTVLAAVIMAVMA